MAEAGLLAARQTLMPLAAASRDFVLQQALRDFQSHLDGERRECLARQIQEGFHVQRQLHFPGLSVCLPLDLARSVARPATAGP